MKTMKTLGSLGMAAVAAFSLTNTQGAPAGKTPGVDDPAPPFEAKDQDGKTWRLADLQGKKAVLLYFYPKDNTPGCTKQACGLRDRLSELEKDNVQVLGVSFDTAESHRKFREAHGLNFPLLVDTDGKIADAYGVRRELGKNSARRASFLISPEGKILHVTDTPSADVHLAEMKDAVAKMKKS